MTDHARRRQVLENQYRESYWRRIRDRLWARELCPECGRHESMCECPDDGMWAKPFDWEEN